MTACFEELRRMLAIATLDLNPVLNLLRMFSAALVVVTQSRWKIAGEGKSKPEED